MMALEEDWKKRSSLFWSLDMCQAEQGLGHGEPKPRVSLLQLRRPLSVVPLRGRRRPHGAFCSFAGTFLL